MLGFEPDVLSSEAWAPCPLPPDCLRCNQGAWRDVWWNGAGLADIQFDTHPAIKSLSDLGQVIWPHEIASSAQRQ